MGTVSSLGVGSTLDRTLDRTIASEDFRNTATSHMSAPRRDVVDNIDAFMTTHCARHIEEPLRSTNFRKALGDMGAACPALAPLLLLVTRYLKETSDTLQNIQQTHKEAMARKERELFKKFDVFFEEKIYGILKDKKIMEEQAKRLEQEAFELRKARDEDLMKVKSELMVKMNECEKREDEFRTFRQLIANVFQTNERLSGRIEDLEDILRKHRIDVPPPLQALPDQRSSAETGKAAGGVVSSTNNSGGSISASQQENIISYQQPPRHISTQVPVEFIKASAEEMSAARLTLQKELLNCAFDERTAYRLEVNKLKADNADLKMYIETLEKTVTELHRYIHEKRFLMTDDFGQVPLTPRPRDIPFSIQTELGIDLKKHTGEIMAEMGAVSISLKHQLNSALLRLRQMITVSEWMQEDTLVGLDEQRNGKGVLSTEPMQNWPAVPHFLRTYVYPDVPNMRWTESDAGAIFLEFFKNYKELRKSCIRVRDKKMVQPRVLQMFQRRSANLTVLDATIAQMTRSDRAVPFGYVVSQFIRNYLMMLAPGSTNSNLALPGTLNPTFRSGGEEKVVELEFTRFAYNMWWAAHRYRETQPLCHLFVEIANGRLPLEMFDVMNNCLAFVEACVRCLDTDGSGTFTYSKLAHGVQRMVDDLGVEAGRSAMLACVQTFEENKAPIFGGRVTSAVLLADESYIFVESALSEGGVKQTQSHLPPRITAARLPRKTSQPPGASVFLRYWRRLVMRQYEEEYASLETLLGPLVLESEVVFGLYLLPIPESTAKISEYDQATESTEHFPGLPPDDPMQDDQGSGAEAYAALLRAQEAIFRKRRESRKKLMETIFKELIRELPRLNRSVHFPFSAAQQNSGTGGGKEADAMNTPRHGGHSAKHARRRRRSKATRSLEAVSEDFIVKSDKEVVEWYGFCHAMRQKLLPLTGKIFVTTSLTESPAWLLPSEDEDADEGGSPAPDHNTTVAGQGPENDAPDAKAPTAAEAEAEGEAEGGGELQEGAPNDSTPVILHATLVEHQ